jgi:hypothetical protein
VPDEASFSGFRGQCGFHAHRRRELDRMRDLARILEVLEVDVTEVHSRDPGLIVYEDARQVVAVSWQEIRKERT